MRLPAFVVRTAALAAAVALLAPAGAPAADLPPLKIGVIMSYTGPTPNAGREFDGGSGAFLKQYGDTFAGRKVVLIKRDDGGPNPDVARRLAQELIVQDNVDILVGANWTPVAIALSQVSTQAKKPYLIINSATSNIIKDQPYASRYAMTMAQLTGPLGRWLPRNGIRKVYMMVADFGPGIDSLNSFKPVFSDAGGTIVGEVRVPLNTTDFSAYLQRVVDAKPDALYVFLPTGDIAIAFVKAYQQMGLAKAGIRLVGTGDIVTEDTLAADGDTVLGMISAYHYSEAHDSNLNRRFVRDFNASVKGLRPNLMAVASYDAMHVIYNAVTATKGDTTPDKLIAAIKGQRLESPRGMIYIDPNTRDIVQNVYLRRVEKVKGELQNVEFDRSAMVADPIEK
jgi:branched-chain amino acid transport system substrate-binding protein